MGATCSGKDSIAVRSNLFLFFFSSLLAHCSLVLETSLSIVCGGESLRIAKVQLLLGSLLGTPCQGSYPMGTSSHGSSPVDNSCY